MNINFIKLLNLIWNQVKRILKNYKINERSDFDRITIFMTLQFSFYYQLLLLFYTADIKKNPAEYQGKRQT